MDVKEIIHKIPFVRIILPFMLGMVLAKTIPFFVSICWILLPLLLGVMLFVNINLKVRNSYSYRWINGALFFFVFCLFGALLYHKHDANVTGIQSNTSSHLVRVIEEPIEKDRSVFLMVQSHFSDTMPSSKAIVYIEKDSNAVRIKHGDLIFMETQFSNIPSSGVPNGFNYAWWMHKQHVKSQAYVTKNDWRFVAGNTGRISGRLRQKVRRYVNSLFVNNIDEKGHAVLMALLLGEKRYVDKEQKQAFRDAGVLHVLAVSGLHVGIFYLFLSSALFFMKRKRWLIVLRSIIIWNVLLAFAFVAGFSPSVVRAVWMFFLLDVGMLITKKSSAYNIIAASAFAILLVDPHTLFEPGFWLSYCAVLSIITFFPLMKRVWNPGNPILVKLRDLLGLSIAVQPGTAPLSIYLFNQFPVWFLVANLVAVPLVGLIINLAFITIILSLFSNTFTWPFKIIQFLLDILDGSLTSIANFPAAVIKGIAFNELEMVLLMMLAVLLAWFIWMRDRKTVIPMLIVVNLFLIGFFTRRVINQEHSELVLFESFGETGIFLKQGVRGTWFANPDPDDNYQILNKYMALNGIDLVESIPLKVVKHVEDRKSEAVYTYFSACQKNQIHTFFQENDIPENTRIITDVTLGRYKKPVYELLLMPKNSADLKALIWNSEQKGTVFMLDYMGLRELDLQKEGALKLKL